MKIQNDIFLPLEILKKCIFSQKSRLDILLDILETYLKISQLAMFKKIDIFLFRKTPIRILFMKSSPRNIKKKKYKMLT